MNIRNILRSVIMLVILAIPFIYLARVYPSLPDMVAKHFNWKGLPDAYTPKNQLWQIIFVTSIVAVAVYLLLIYLNRIDPKKKADLSKDSFRKIAMAVVIFIAATNIVIVHASLENRIVFEKLPFCLLGLFFAYLGNSMNSIKPNYFVGIRTPWALENEANWKATHRLGGKLFFAGGILIFICALLLPTPLAEPTLATLIGVMVLIPVVYSYVYFRKHSIKNPNQS